LHRQVRQPSLFAPDEFSCGSAARETDSELRSKAKDGVVPPFVNGRDIKCSEFGMLCLNQRANQVLIDLDFRWRGTTIQVDTLNEILRWTTGLAPRRHEN
jgi:hypothetical protein